MQDWKLEGKAITEYGEANGESEDCRHKTTEVDVIDRKHKISKDQLR